MSPPAHPVPLPLLRCDPFHSAPVALPPSDYGLHFAHPSGKLEPPLSPYPPNHVSIFVFLLYLFTSAFLKVFVCPYRANSCLKFILHLVISLISLQVKANHLFFFSNFAEKLDMVSHVYNPSIPEAEAGEGSPELYKQFPGRIRLQRENESQTKHFTRS